MLHSSTLKYATIIFFVILMFKELSGTTSFLRLFRVVYGRNTTIYGCYAWIVLTFIFVPGLFNLLVTLFYVKYHIIEPARIKTVFYLLCYTYIRGITNCLLYGLITFFAFCVGNLVTYSFIRFAASHPESIISTVFSASLVLSIYITTAMMFLLLIFTTSGRVMTRFANANDLGGFVKRNWALYGGILGIFLAYIIQIFYFLSRVTSQSDKTTDYDSAAEMILGSIMCCLVSGLDFLTEVL